MQTNHLYIIDILPYRLSSVVLTGFSLVRRNDVTVTITHHFPMYSYRMLVIYCSILLLKVWKKEQAKAVIRLREASTQFFLAKI